MSSSRNLEAHINLKMKHYLELTIKLKSMFLNHGIKACSHAIVFEQEFVFIFLPGTMI